MGVCMVSVWTLENECSMTDSTENAVPPKTTNSENSNSSVQCQIVPNFQFVFVPKDVEESQFFDSVDFGGVSLLVESVLYWHMGTRQVCIDTCNASL